MTLPLSDILVLDMSRVVAGPSATQTLGDLGANVVKVERRIQGDDQRLVGPPWMSGPNGEPLEEATYFQAVNRNKRSITVDYTKKEGADLLRDMAAKADVFFENYRTGTLAKYGLSYEDIKAINPRIVYCSLTGFGQTGPYSNRSGYDLLVQGMGGMMSINGLADGEPGAGPMRVGIPLADIFAGMNATMGVLAALRHRDKTGRGQYLDIALLDSQIAAMLNPFAAWFNAGVNLPRTGNHHPSAAPYGVYRASDGYILIATFNDREFARLAEAIGRAHWLKDPRYARSGARVENRHALIEDMTEALSHKTRDEWVEILIDAVVSCGPINDMTDIEKDPHVLARNLIMKMPSKMTGEYIFPANPIRLSDTPVEYRYAPPSIGEHTSEILAEVLGLDSDAVNGLKAREVI